MGSFQGEENGLKIGGNLLWQGFTGRLLGIGKTVAVFFAFAWLFYDTWLAVLLFLPLTRSVGRYIRKLDARKRLDEGRIQFRDFLNSLTASMHTGYAVENAISEAYHELAELYGKNAFIPKELERVLRQMKLNRPAEEVLEEFGRRSGLEDARNFASIFKIAKRSSGNLAAIMSNTAETIGKKLETQREIQVLVQEKRYEQKVMNIMPLAMIFYLRMGNGEFMNILYTTFAGRVIMTVCLLIYLASYYIAEKIVDIKI